VYRTNVTYSRNESYALVGPVDHLVDVVGEGLEKRKDIAAVIDLELSSTAHSQSVFFSFYSSADRNDRSAKQALVLSLFHLRAFGDTNCWC
jgi:hypothetical protein